LYVIKLIHGKIQDRVREIMVTCIILYRASKTEIFKDTIQSKIAVYGIQPSTVFHVWHMIIFVPY
jgi:hypothetical protein